MVTLAYLTNYNDDRVSVLDTATNAVIATVNVGGSPLGVSAVCFVQDVLDQPGSSDVASTYPP